MKITIDIDQQDIINASPEAFSGLFAALKGISNSSKGEVENETNNEASESPERSVATKQKKEAATKTSEGKKNPVKSGSLKVEGAKAAETKKDVAEAKAPEPEDTEEVVAEEETAAEEAPKGKKVDRAAISERLKEIAKNGKAEGKPKKIKALLQEYGVEKVPDLPDDKLEEFLEKVEAL